MEPFLVASDIGGTFTDTVTIDASGTVRRYKAPTVPDDPAAGVLATLELAAAESGDALPDLLGRISLFAHGTTASARRSASCRPAASATRCRSCAASSRWASSRMPSRASARWSSRSSSSPRA